MLLLGEYINITAGNEEFTRNDYNTNFFPNCLDHSERQEWIKLQEQIKSFQANGDNLNNATASITKGYNNWKKALLLHGLHLSGHIHQEYKKIHSTSSLSHRPSETILDSDIGPYRYYKEFKNNSIHNNTKPTVNFSSRAYEGDEYYGDIDQDNNKYPLSLEREQAASSSNSYIEVDQELTMPIVVATSTSLIGRGWKYCLVGLGTVLGGMGIYSGYKWIMDKIGFSGEDEPQAAMLLGGGKHLGSPSKYNIGIRNVDFDTISLDGLQEIGIPDSYNDKNTPLHIAVRQNNFDQVKLIMNSSYINDMLVEALTNLNIDVDAQNSNNQASLHLATEGGYDNIVLLLLYANADINVVDQENNTPLDTAIQKNNIKTVKILLPFYLNDYGLEHLDTSTYDNNIKDVARNIIYNAIKDKHKKKITLLNAFNINNEELQTQFNCTAASTCHRLWDPLPYHNTQIRYYLSAALMLSTSFDELEINKVYITYLGNLLQKDKHSLSEKEKLLSLYDEAMSFAKKFPVGNLLNYKFTVSSHTPSKDLEIKELVKNLVSQNFNTILFSYGFHTFIVKKLENSCIFFNPSLNYFHYFSLDPDYILNITKAFFQFLYSEPKFNVYTIKLKEWQKPSDLKLIPDKIISDFDLILRDKFSAIKKSTGVRVLNLTGLDLGNTEMRILAKDKRLKDVEQLYLDNNNITRFYESIYLTGASIISVKNNDIQKIDYDESSLSSLHNLESIDFYQKDMDLDSMEFLIALNKTRFGKKLNINLRVMQNAALQTLINAGGIGQYFERIHFENIMDNVKSYIKDAAKLKTYKTLQTIQFLHGLHGTIALCTHAALTDCLLTSAAGGYTLVAGKVGDTINHHAKPFIFHSVYIGSKIGIIPYSKIRNVKLGFQKIILGTAEGVFDLIDIGRSIDELFDCMQAKCTNKVVHDGVVSSIFSSTAFSGNMVYIFKDKIKNALRFNFVLMVLHTIYNGISNNLEISKQFKRTLTFGERTSIMLRTTLFMDLEPKLQKLLTRAAVVDEMTELAFKFLNDHNNITMYGFALGQLDESHFTVVPSFSKIDMSIKDIDYTKGISRIAPTLKGAVMLCLPRGTPQDAVHINNPTAMYYCDNAVVLTLANKHLNSAATPRMIVYELQHMDSGDVVGSNELDNVFIINSGRYNVFGGENINNVFLYNNLSTFRGMAYFGESSTNIIRSWANCTKTAQFFIQDYGVRTYSDYDLSTKPLNDIAVYFHGNNNTIEIVTCDTNVKNKVSVDAYGGLSMTNPDTINHCPYVYIRPYTVILGPDRESILYFSSINFKTNDIQNVANITATKESTILFEDIYVLHYLSAGTYSEKENILVLTMYDQITNSSFILNMHNYLNQNYTPNYSLCDKSGAILEPILLGEKNITYFQLNIFLTQKDSGLINSSKELFDTLVKWYKLISFHSSNLSTSVRIEGQKDTTDYVAYFGFAKRKNVFMLGHSSFVFAVGGEMSDIYTYNSTTACNKNSIIYINNHCENRKFDFLYIINKIDITIQEQSPDLSFLIPCTDNSFVMNIHIQNYFTAPSYQHIVVVDYKYQTFLPIRLENVIQLIPFYHPIDLDDYSVDVENKGITIIHPNNTPSILYSTKEQMKVLTIQQNLVVISYDKNNVSMILLLKDFVNMPEQWINFKLYLYNYDGVYTAPLDLHSLIDKNIIDEDNPDYSSIFTIYNVDYTDSMTIHHNQEQTVLNNSTVIFNPKNADQCTIGIIRFHNINPDDLSIDSIFDDLIIKHRVYDITLTIKNFYKNNNDLVNFQISVFEFADLMYSSYLEDIIVYHPVNHWIDIVTQFHYAARLYHAQLILYTKYEKCYDNELLTCILALRDLDYEGIYYMLGFSSLNRLMEYARFCEFRKSDLIEFKDCINNDLLTQYKAILEYRLFMRGHSIEQTHIYISMLENIGSSREIKAVIDDILD